MSGRIRYPAPVISHPQGFTLIELVVTLTVISILTLGIIPLVKTSVKRQREQQLREALRTMRTAIDEFKRDTNGMQCGGPEEMREGLGRGGPQGPPVPPPPAPPGVPMQGGGEGTQGGEGPQRPPAPPGPPTDLIPFSDPRSRVIISDCKIFGVDNLDRYPPDLETLVKGVDVIPRAAKGKGMGMGQQQSVFEQSATEDSGAAKPKKKVYLRKIPVDPMTGRAEWDLRSCYDAPDATTWGRQNVWDVRSKSEETALDGTKYNEW
jgi:prepilin-type N-terminal cleavage/methylation domain-containing protein